MNVAIIYLILFVMGGVSYGQSSALSGVVDNNWKQLQCFNAKLVVKKVLGFQTGEDYSAVFDWTEDVESHFINHLILSRFGQTSFNIDESYDGSNYTLIDKSGTAALCKAGKSLPADVKSCELGICPLEPFRFLTKAATAADVVHPTLRCLVDGLNGDLLTSAIASAKDAVFQDKAAEYFETDGGQGIQYRVFLAKDSHQLLGWQRFSSQKRLRTELTIGSWKTCKVGEQKLPYPASFAIRDFQDAQTSNGYVITYQYAATVDLSDLSGHSDPTTFSLDPSAADYIWDMDKKVLVPVPR